jgi:hypothetical protein
MLDWAKNEKDLANFIMKGGYNKMIKLGVQLDDTNVWIERAKE